MGETCLKVVINGRVQGVGYRAWMARRAAELGLKGWVRNRSEGSVEAVLLGPADVVGTMVDLCRRGPRLSVVTDVETSPAVNEDWQDFSVRSTR
jgi:acylphosphatase